MIKFLFWFTKFLHLDFTNRSDVFQSGEDLHGIFFDPGFIAPKIKKTLRKMSVPDYVVNLLCLWSSDEDVFYSISFLGSEKSFRTRFESFSNLKPYQASKAHREVYKFLFKVMLFAPVTWIRGTILILLVCVSPLFWLLNFVSNGFKKLIGLLLRW